MEEAEAQQDTHRCPHHSEAESTDHHPPYCHYWCCKCADDEVCLVNNYAAGFPPVTPEGLSLIHTIHEHLDANSEPGYMCMPVGTYQEVYGPHDVLHWLDQASQLQNEETLGCAEKLAQLESLVNRIRDEVLVDKFLPTNYTYPYSTPILDAQGTPLGGLELTTLTNNFVDIETNDGIDLTKVHVDGGQKY